MEGIQSKGAVGRPGEGAVKGLPARRQLEFPMARSKGRELGLCQHFPSTGGGIGIGIRIGIGAWACEKQRSKAGFSWQVCDAKHSHEEKGKDRRRILCFPSPSHQ